MRLDLVDLDQDRLGYTRFISSWVIRDGGRTLVVDPGPPSTIPHLRGALAALGVVRVDGVLLTHIHIDHGGGAAHLVQDHPGAWVYCHESGRRHLVSPERLWQGSLTVLRDVARMFGPPAPLPAERLVDEAALAALGIEVIPTPGHAVHHVAFQVQDVLFAGEALGTHQRLSTGQPYLRPATPPRFLPEVALASIARLAGREGRVAFAHYGLSEDPALWAARATAQIHRWMTWARQTAQREDWEPAFRALVLAEDPYCGGAQHLALSPAVRERELNFLGNTLRGMHGAALEGC
ncbi:MAG: MBL fold metallo-hydrolase [Deltaproteobacteria bacterium]|nr:MBL fold metallo-hydrolase [Deltaproteobacteria bacterium]